MSRADQSMGRGGLEVVRESVVQVYCAENECAAIWMAACSKPGWDEAGSGEFVKVLDQASALTRGKLRCGRRQGEDMRRVRVRNMIESEDGVTGAIWSGK